MKKLILLVLIGWAIQTSAFDGVYVGGQLGQLGLSGNTTAAGHGSGTIGFGIDLGIRTGGFWDLLFQYQYSSHNNGLKLSNLTIGPELQIGPYNDFYFTLGLSPGFHIFNAAQSETKFGISFSGGSDIWLEDLVRMGLVFRYTSIFGGVIGDAFWSVMLRFGYVFES